MTPSSHESQARASADLVALAAALARGEDPGGVHILKRNPVRCVALADTVVLKVLLARPHRATREVRNLARARALGVPVPELVASGAGWLATRFAPGRPAQREDLRALLESIEQMHGRGMLHRDLHLGNLRMTARGPLILDVQKALFLRRIPRWLQRRELGYLAHSLGDPLPGELAHAAFWRALRAQRHWRSRTRRCLVESSGFTRFHCEGRSGWQRREIAAEQIAAVLAARGAGEVLKDQRGLRIVRAGGWIAKQHRSARRARAAWRAGHGLEVRGIATGRALACWGRWLVMDDAGATLASWVDAEYSRAGEAERKQALEAAADLLARLHTRGIYHADLKANNIAWTPGGAARLLDYGRVHFGLRVSRRRRIKNLAQLNAALPDLVPAEHRELALSRYLQGMGHAARERGSAAGARVAAGGSRAADPAARARPEDPALRDAVIRASLSRAHRWSGC